MVNSKQEIIFTETDDKIIDFFCTGLKEGKTNSILLETAQRIFVSEDHKDFIYLYKLAKVKYNFVSNNKKLFNTASIWEGVLSHGQYNG